MTIQEMHIEIDLGLQRLNSFNTKNFLPQELDWLINNEVIKYIKSKISPDSNIKKKGFQDDSKRVADLRDLIRTVNRPVINDNQRGNYISFPSDYFHWVRFDSKLKKNCENITITNSNINLKKVIFPINIFNLNTTLNTFKIDIVVGEDTITLFELTDLPTGYLNTNNFDSQAFILIQALKILLQRKLEELYPSSNVSLYWQIDAYDFYRNSFILYIGEQLERVSITINNNTTNYSAIGATEVYISNTDLIGNIRVVDEEYRGQADRNSLSKSRPNSLISSVRQNTLNLSIPDDVVVGSVDMVYICQPSIVDLHLNNNLNMSNSVCKEIIDNTVRFLKALVEDGNYEAYVRENMLIE